MSYDAEVRKLLPPNPSHPRTSVKFTVSPPPTNAISTQHVNKIGTGKARIRIRNSLLRTLNQYFDSLPCFYFAERILGVLEFDFACNELLDRNAFRGHKIDGRCVIAGSVAEGSLHVELLGAHGHDGERDVWLAHATL